MSIPLNKMVTYQDLKTLIATGDFGEKEVFTSSLKCANKSEVDRVLIFEATTEFNGLTANQLVPRRTLDSSSENPTSFTMTVTATSYSCSFLIRWGTSHPRGTILPTILKYELHITGYFDSGTSARTENYLVDGIGGGNIHFGLTGITYSIPRTCSTFDFKMRSYDTNGAMSDWTSVVPKNAELDWVYFTNEFINFTEHNLIVEYQDEDEIIAAKITTDGQFVYFILDKGIINAAVYGYRLATLGELSSIIIPTDEDDIIKDTLITTNNNINNGGVFSDDGMHGMLIYPIRTIQQVTNATGWAPNMNFAKTASVTFYNIVKEISDVIVSPIGRTMYISDTMSNEIMVIDLAEPWELKNASNFPTWDYGTPIALGDGPFTAQGYIVDGVLAMAAVNNGYGLRLEVIFKQTVDFPGGHDKDTLFVGVVFVNSSQTWGWNFPFPRTIDWSDDCSDWRYYSTGSHDYKDICTREIYPLQNSGVCTHSGHISVLDRGVLPDTYNLFTRVSK